ncbi:HAD family hydrolase [Marisediminicola antarctica]|uniref:Phosphatase n=2 Tax=Marisediminicola antarctica TaxID=674079 RepID=A0A7L5AFR9_9MICO|nr:phosphatase [Marisediminicola antarctica]
MLGAAFDAVLFDAVLFDMDGTLIDSTPAVERSWLQWAGEYGVEQSFRDGGHGQPARDLVASLVSEQQFSEAYARIQQIETGDIDGITVLPGVEATLVAIDAHRKAIVTSCTRALAEARIGAAGIVAPDLVITVDDVEFGKPHPHPFLAGAAGLGFDPARCLVIEDAPAGLASGRAAGCVTIGVAGTHSRADLDADLVVDSLTELVFTSTGAGVTVTRAD